MDYEIEKIIKTALEEDIGKVDITTAAIVQDVVSGEGIFLVKQTGTGLFEHERRNSHYPHDAQGS